MSLCLPPPLALAFCLAPVRVCERESVCVRVRRENDTQREWMKRETERECVCVCARAHRRVRVALSMCVRVGAYVYAGVFACFYVCDA